MEEKEHVKPAENAKECTCTEGKGKCCGDFRVFLIAFLTSVIVLAVYHFGMRLCAIQSGPGKCGGMPAPAGYVLVPVNAMPACPAFMGRQGGMPHRFGREGMVPGRRFGKDGMVPGRRFGKGERPMPPPAPKKDAPAVEQGKQPKPASPAPAPVKQTK